MATETQTPKVNGLVFTRKVKVSTEGVKSKKGLGYIWPEIEPALAKKVRLIAAESGESISEVASKLITFALSHSKIQ